MTEPCGVGIDVAKATLDVAWSTNQTARWQTTNDEEGWAALVAHLRTLQPTVIVLEATGGYEIGAASALSAAGLPVAIVNPRQVRDFAKALGLWEKTDAIDGHLQLEQWQAPLLSDSVSAHFHAAIPVNFTVQPFANPRTGTILHKTRMCRGVQARHERSA